MPAHVQPHHGGTPCVAPPIISALIACIAFVAVRAGRIGQRRLDHHPRSIALHGSVSFPNATGKAVYKVGGGERELQIEVEHIIVLRGKHVNVFVNGNKLASPLVEQPRQDPRRPQHRPGQSVPNIQRLDGAGAHARRHADRRRHVLIDGR